MKATGKSVPGDVIPSDPMQVGVATRQVTHHGSEAQRAEAAKVLADTRRALYKILAEDE